MAFNSFQFIFFLALLVIIYWRLPTLRWQNILLLIGSYFFYALWDWRFLSLIIISTIVDYSVGIVLARTDKAYQRRVLLLVSIGTNLGILGFFKYFNFFVESFSDLLQVVGLQANLTTLSIILPVGISFYTFQTLSYTIDIYRKQLEPTHDLLNFALFVCFFPQLVAGPIERASRLLPQIESARTIDPRRFESGLILILLGLFKKVAIADVAATLMNPLAFATPAEVTSGAVLQAIYLFAIQIYADFAAYSDIARGTARLFGIELMENFNQPYFAQSMSEFWRRWHISLSTWLRDYVYIPLNNLCRQRLNNEFIIYAISVLGTMFLSGLWHGANYTFILWGVLLGIFQVMYRPFKGKGTHLTQHDNPTIRWFVMGLRALLLFHLVLVSWVFFRIPTVRIAPDFYIGMLKGYLGFDTSLLLPVVLLYALSFAIDSAQVYQREHAFTLALARPMRVILYVAALLGMTYVIIKPYVPFIYFQF